MGALGSMGVNLGRSRLRNLANIPDRLTSRADHDRIQHGVFGSACPSHHGFIVKRYDDGSEMAF